MNLQDVSHIHIPDGDVRMIHDSDNRLLWGAVGYNVLFSGNTFQQSYTGQNLYNVAEVTTGTYVTKDDDGWITITRDNTSGSSTVFTNVWTNNLALETSTQYKIFIEVKAISGTGSLFITSSNSTGTEGQFGNKTLDFANMVAGQTYTISPTTKSSFSGVSKGLRTFSQQTVGQGGSVTFRLSVCAYTTPTETFSYEPYTGGQPSPSPDYPQQIQTVTGEQTVVVTGKNLLNAVPYANPIQQGVEVTITNTNTIHIEGTSTQTYVNLTRIFSTNLPAGTYTMSINKELPFRVNLSTILSGGGSLDRSIQAGETSVTFTTSETTTGMRIFMSTGGAGIVFDETFTVQLVSGNAADYDFEPYSSANYPISLGSIELCKLGTYQDYIYKDGSDWKVHKDIGKYQFNGSEPWVRSGSTTSDVFVAVIASALQNYLKVKDRTTLKSPYFIQNSRISTSSGQMDAYNGSATAPASFALSFNATSITNITDAATWISNNKPTVYSAINNQADTTITNQTLIAQLEAIYNLVRRYGYNFVVSASGNNLPIIIDRTLL